MLLDLLKGERDPQAEVKIRGELIIRELCGAPVDQRAPSILPKLRQRPQRDAKE